ncbi:MAG: hypothetical protein ACXWDF_12065 [Aeromicrobium sp.]
MVDEQDAGDETDHHNRHGPDRVGAQQQQRPTEQHSEHAADDEQPDSRLLATTIERIGVQQGLLDVGRLRTPSASQSPCAAPGTPYRTLNPPSNPKRPFTTFRLIIESEKISVPSWPCGFDSRHPLNT